MKVNLGITVNELFELCRNQIEKGNGAKHILISSDKEGNNFHTLFYGFTDNPEEIQYLLKLKQDRIHIIDTFVLLG